MDKESEGYKVWLTEQWADINARKAELKRQYGELYRQEITQRMDFAIGLIKNHVNLLQKIAAMGLAPEVTDEAMATLVELADENAKFLITLKDAILYEKPE